MTVYPLTFQIGRLEITGFGIMLAVGFVIAAWLVGLELRRRHWNQDYTADLVAGAVVGGLLGAKLWYVAQSGDVSALLSRHGMVWYGGLAGGAIAVLLNGVRLEVPTRATMDLVAPALAAAYALGRIGCFLVGDDYGLPTDLPWGVKFPQGLPPSTADNLASQFGVASAVGTPPTAILAVHPTQLYEAAAMIVAFMLLWRWRLRARPLGWLFGAYLLLAGVERLLIEIVRAKADRVIGPLSVAQLASLVAIGAGWSIIRRLGGAPEPLPGPYLSPVPDA